MAFLKSKVKVEPSDRVNTRIKAYRPANSRRAFRLSEFVVIDGADLKDGILVVYARVELPEEKRPRKIELGSAGDQRKKNI